MTNSLRALIFLLIPNSAEELRRLPESQRFGYRLVAGQGAVFAHQLARFRRLNGFYGRIARLARGRRRPKGWRR
jgi:hypothetical protein